MICKEIWSVDSLQQPLHCSKTANNQVSSQQSAFSSQEADCSTSPSFLIKCKVDVNLNTPLPPFSVLTERD